MARRSPFRKRKGKGVPFERIVIVGIIIAVLVIALTLWGPLRKFRVDEVKRPAPQTQKQEPVKKKAGKKDRKKTSTSIKHTKGPAAKRTDRTVLVAIVIDDLGQDMKQAKEVLDLPKKITISILPGLAQSKKIAELAGQKGHEVLLHMPMERKNDHEKRTSPGTLSADMTPMDFLTTVSDDMASVPGAVGVNNHEGSALTENSEAMKFLMAELRNRDLFFLDSVTSPKSVAYDTAREFGMKAATRDVFLDNEGDNPEYIRGQLEKLMDIARDHGKAIGIGHPHPATLSELRTWLAKTGTLGIKIVPVSKLMQ
jgi:polysaccharide deacetylase 2 family uncharacterized protein YibQ